MMVIYFSFSLKDYLEKNDSTSESVVWEFLVDLSLVGIEMMKCTTVVSICTQSCHLALRV